MSKKLLSIVSTERKKGNSVLASKYIAKALNAELEIINLVKKDIRPCKACYRCLYGEDCKIDDDVEEILRKIDECDVLLISSPVYWLDATGNLKAFIDRCFMSMKYFERFKNKKGVVLTFHGFEDMKGWASATHLVLAKVLGVDVLANIEIKSALPAEMFMTESIKKLDLVAEAIKEEKRVVMDGQCPVCLNTVFRVIDGKLDCPVCGSLLDTELNILKRGERFTPEWVVKHFSVELIGLKEKYKEIKDELKRQTEMIFGESD
ncbi:hypothetical protein Asulf_00803 [Archaeoglobus sulfaticallidus PM70-1]|uniref:NADPH-dependent FMN reductase-like domain-containing protein n=1 Tax=Archaeoglobus sulfaticallidus PM70-1 TaxID=387631 RepID=N0BEW2_9EURY|nr:flavodoxin family protein [Archaeoglobus sulfaticallidus]AGK60812.1 hypothetical protein Asulf_00803 [Archaeoglobus sulfaticallidus PM70-1]